MQAECLWLHPPESSPTHLLWLAHTLLLTVPILTMPILAVPIITDAPLTNDDPLALTHGSHTLASTPLSVSGLTLLTHTPHAHTLLLAVPILTDAPLTHLALTCGSHAPRKLPVHPSPHCTHPTVFPGHLHRGKGSGGDAGWWAGCKFEGRSESVV